MVEKLTEELATFQATLPPEASLASSPQVSAPALGERVRLSGMRNRSQFNGTVGEVASSDIDRDGFLLVKVCVPGEESGSMKKGVRQMRVHHKRVELLGSVSSPVLQR